MATENNIIENIVGLREGFNSWLLAHATPANIVTFVCAIYVIGTAVYIFDFSSNSYKDSEWGLSLVAFRNVLGFNFLLSVLVFLFIFAFPQGRFTGLSKEFLENNTVLLVKWMVILFAVSLVSALAGMIYHFIRMKRY